MSSVLELYASGRAVSGMSFFLSSWSIKTVILFWLFWKWVPRLDGFCSGAIGFGILFEMNLFILSRVDLGIILLNNDCFHRLRWLRGSLNGDATSIFHYEIIVLHHDGLYKFILTFHYSPSASLRDLDCESRKGASPRLQTRSPARSSA